MQGFQDFFAPIHFSEHDHTIYDPNQIGAQIQILKPTDSNWGDADVILLGCGEQRGAGLSMTSYAPDAVRAAFYKLYMWHQAVTIADAGNLILGNSQEDSYSALSLVLEDMHKAGKRVIIIGGSHDLTLAQYMAFQRLQKMVNVAVVDAYIDLKEEERPSSTGFLMELLTGPKNFVRHFTQIGFQSYFVNPNVIQTLDKLRFDCYRLGVVKTYSESVEPDLRDVDILSVDLNALMQAEAPYLQHGSPNGFTNVEMCEFFKYAAMNDKVQTVGIYGYMEDNDINNMGAMSIAQMIWYYLDGIHAQQYEIPLDNLEAYEQFQTAFTGNDTLFIKSMRTERWWMQLPNKQFIPCSYEDYLIAANNEIPERWFRAQERIV